jgi:trigger factor
MQVTQINADGLKHEFKVVVPKGHLEEKVENRLAEVGRTVRIPGFRPGKVPMGLLRKKYGSSVLGEVMETAVNDGARQAIESNKLRPALQPKIEITSFQADGDLEFTVAVEVLPEVKVMELGGLALERPISEVTDEQVEQALKSIATRHDKTEPAADDHKAQTGDVAIIDFVGKLNGEPFDGGNGEGYPLKLGSASFIPGFEDQLIGVGKGDERVVRVAFPADYGNSELAGKDVEFDVKVQDVREVIPTPVDDDLAKAVGANDLDGLKKALRDELERENAGLSRLHVKRRLLDLLAENHTFGVPEGMVELEFDAIWKEIEKDRADGRLDAADQAKSEEELKTDYRAIAERRVRLGLVLSEIGRQNNITVTQEDLNRALLNEARRFRGQEHLVLQYYQKHPDALDSLRAPILEDKVIDFILELAKVTNKTVTIEDLRKDPDPDQPEAAVKTEKTAGKLKAATAE